jgi:hypothetical protein
MARPSFQATEKDRRMVKSMSAYGCRHEDIAKVFDISPKTLRKHFRSELDLGAIEANSEVIGSLYRMATSGRNTAAAIFWVKTRCGWREKPREESEGQTQGTPPIVVLGE